MPEQQNRRNLTRATRFLPGSATIISLSALIVSVISAYFSIAPGYSIDAVRSYQYDIVNGTIHISHVLHNGGNRSVSVFDVHTFQGYGSGYQRPNSICDGRIEAQFNGELIKPIEPTTQQNFEIDPVVVSPGQHVRINVSYRLNKIAKGLESVGKIHFVCSTPIIWISDLGYVSADYRMPIFLVENEEYGDLLASGRGTASTEINAFDTLYIRFIAPWFKTKD